MKILMTGANGMAGKNLVEILTDQYCKILAPTRSQLDIIKSYTYLSNSRFAISENGKIYKTSFDFEDIVGGIQEKTLNPIAYLSNKF